MSRYLLFQLMSVLLAILHLPMQAHARQWAFDEKTQPGLAALGGEPQIALGVHRRALVFDGSVVLQVKDSATATHHEGGFTCAVWVNPYATKRGQQMVVAKNRYALDEREWGVMIDEDGRYRLYVKQGGWKTLDADTLPTTGSWQHVAVAISEKVARLWINGQPSGRLRLEHPLPKTKAPLTFGGINDDGRIWQNLFGALDEAVLFDREMTDDEVAALYEKHQAAAAAAEPHSPPLPRIYELWTGGSIPQSPKEIPFAKSMKHHTVHRPGEGGYKFLHGAAITHHEGTLFANWANSPTNENGPHETLRGRRSTDGGLTWSALEVIGPGFDGGECHSHGILFAHRGELWAICARFGGRGGGRRFPGLKAEAFVLEDAGNKWESRGIVMENCWPYDEPVRMGNGNYITGGQDKDGLPVVAVSHGDDMTKWDSVLIPYEPALKPSFAETTVWAEGERVLAVIRGGEGVAWVSTSDDYGRTWAKACRSNLPMPRSKAYLGRLSTGQWYLVANFRDRDTLVVYVGRPGENTLSSVWRIRHGKSEPPRFPGRAKSKQWSYPYGYEHEGDLYVVYSIGKEDCGLTVIPVESLAAANTL